MATKRRGPGAAGLAFADPLAGRPLLSPQEAETLAEAHWGVVGAAVPLAGERDRNFLLEDARKRRFVLKVSTAGEFAERLDMHHALVQQVAAGAPEIRLPTAMPTLAGEARVSARCRGGSHLVRLFPYLEGRPLSGIPGRPKALLDAVGRLLGRLQRALADFGHPGLDRPDLPWAPRNARAVIEAAAAVFREDGGERADLYLRVAERVLPRLGELLALPSGALHNDANDDNLLLAGAAPEEARPEDLALLDLGDALRGPGIVEAANGALYLSLAADEPLRAAAEVLAGFAAERPVSGEEASLFRTGYAARALVSGGIARLRRREGADRGLDPYLLVSESGVFRVLREIAAEPEPLTTGRFRVAAGHPPLPGGAAFPAALEKAAAEALPVLAPRREAAVLDLTPASPAVDPAQAAETLETAVRAALAGGTGVAVGRYREPRLPEVFPAPTAPREEPRTVTLGIEIFAPPGESVAAPLPGVVAGSGPEAEAGRGFRVELRHRAGAVGFRTICRGLSRPSAAVAAGAALGAGEPLGVLASPEENGGWPSHLHFMVVAEPEGEAPPGSLPEPLGGRIGPTGRASDLAVLSALCPDPSPLLAGVWGPAGGGERTAAAPADAFDRERPLRAARARRISAALSVAYGGRALHLVRGRGARLYDSAGRDYLDLVNNVCQVGHAHPRVAEALSRQAALLNTNTRYLYAHLTDYAEALTATLPAPLSVVFLTNSGSEANDLALRIARERVGNRRTLVFEGGYHGNLTSLIEVSPYKLDGPGGGPGAPDLVRLPMPDLYRGRFRDPDPERGARALIADAVRRVEAAGPATLLAESILSCGGQVVPPPGYLRALYAAVRRAGGVVVADEVQTGFGRVGPAFWAFSEVGEDPDSPGEAVVPDLVTFGKPAGNGHPLGGVVTGPESARSFETGMEYFNTFGGNPVSCAAGLAVLSVLREEGLAEHAATLGKRLFEGLSELAGEYPMLGQVRGRGLFLGVELVQDPETRAPATGEARRLVGRLRELRILNSTDGPDANVLKLKPPLVFSAADADRYLEMLALALKEAR